MHSSNAMTNVVHCAHSVAIVLPPLGVFFERGCNCDVLINIGLTCLGYIPGISK